MPRGVTPTRVRRRQSDAKWRASVAMCYNIMKNVIPNQKKLGRRKVSKALTLKETERHIVNLERKLRELIEERAPMCGKVIMIEKEDNCMVPATFDDIKQDFATKQHALFMCTTTGGKKRYNVPSDIEASLEQLSQQSCDLTAMNRKELEVSFPHLLQVMDTPRFKPQTSVSSESSGKLQSLLNTPLDDVSSRASNIHKTPAKKQGSLVSKVIICTSEKEEEASTKLVNNLKPSTMKACKQLPFTSKPQTSTKTKPVSLLSGRNYSQTSLQTFNPSTETCTNFSPNTPLQSSYLTSKLSTETSKQTYSSSTRTSIETCTQPSSQESSASSKASDQALATSLAAKSTQMSSHGSGGFTPVKLPYGLDNGDPMLTFSGTPAKSTIGSPLGYLSIPETPGSCFNGVDYFDLTDEEDVAGLLCTESIDSMDLDTTFSDKSPSDTAERKTQTIPDTRCETVRDNSKNTTVQTKVRRRLDRDYGSSNDQKVPTTDKSCLEFDGYLLFHKYNAALMDPGCSSSKKALTIADMWEKLEPEDRTRYARIASLDQSDDSNDLSADLLGIDLKPLHKEHTAGIGNIQEDTGSQEVPSLVLDLSDEMHRNFELQFIEGYEDLGVFYHSDVLKENLSRDSSEGFHDLEQETQVVPQMG
ncbi:uncharacterized protein LOC123536222 isoform X2 [Mercenaria mercenaria]|uniref:uncharacterized protein LOC123536222 isoform X2 n=1 Tax=Mercenaria mercenaria TaxID=6596 RepID=UPI00234EB747|nr:uncharacterized protein LOC123536222 isoform X2 [Mercenaria mercenaria]